MVYLLVVKVVVRKNIFIYDIDFEDGNFVGEIARRSIGNTRKKYSIYNTTNTLFTSKKRHLLQMLPMPSLRYFCQKVTSLQLPIS